MFLFHSSARINDHTFNVTRKMDPMEFVWDSKYSEKEMTFAGLCTNVKERKSVLSLARTMFLRIFVSCI